MKKLISQTWEISGLTEGNDKIIVEAEFDKTQNIIYIHKGDKMITFENQQINDMLEIMQTICKN